MPRIAKEDMCGAKGPQGMKCGRAKGHDGPHNTTQEGTRYMWGDGKPKKAAIPTKRYAKPQEEEEEEAEAEEEEDEEEEEEMVSVMEARTRTIPTFSCPECDAQLEFGVMKAREQ